MKNTLHFFFIIIFLLSGINSFAKNNTNASFVCPTATISYSSLKFCTSNTNIQSVNITGTDAYLGGVFTSTSGLTLNPATGAITPSTSTPGIYMVSYTIPSGPGCPSTMVTTNVEIVAKANAGMETNMTICESNTSVINLFMLLSGEQAGGTWARISGTGGTFNAGAGTFTPAIGTINSAFTYTVTASAPCSDDTSVVTISFNASPTGISISGGTTTCSGTPVNLTITGTPNAVITMTDGSISYTYTIGSSGVIIIPVTPTVTSTYSLLSASLNGCSIPLTQSTTVVVSATPQFITQIPDIIICNGSGLDIASQLTSTIPGTTFIWSATTSNVNTASISGDDTNIDQIVNLINNLQTGTISISVIPQIGNCSGAQQQILVTVSPIPVITSTVANNTVICNNEFVTITSTSNSTTAYNWQVNSSSGVQIAGGAINGTSTTGIVNLQLALSNPLISGTISFNLTPVNGICTGATIMNALTITVNPIPGTPISLATNEICSGEITNLTISSFPTIAGTTLEWSILDSQNVTGFTNGTGTSPFTISDLLINTSNIQGYVKYNVTSKLGNCEGGTTEFTVLVNPLPKPVLTDGNICIDTTTGITYQGYLLDTQLSNLDFTYDWFLLNTTTNTYDQIAGASASTYQAMVAGSYQVIVTNTITNCIDQASVDVIEVFPATGISKTVSDNSTITVTVNPIGTGNLIYTLDNGAWQASNVFTGVEPGTHTVLVSDLEGCTNLSIEVDVNEEIADLVMYPNPTFDSLSFNNKNKVMSVQISNQLGQVVLTKDIGLKNGIIDLSELNMGIYNVVFETESGIVSHRIIKQ